MRRLWKEHRLNVLLGICVALATSALLNAPLLHSIVVDNELSQPTIVRESSDEEFYLTRIREAADGYPFIGQPYAYEHRENRWGFGFLMEAITGGIISVTGLSMKTVLIIADFALPALLALIVWLLSVPIFAEFYWRIALVVSIFLGQYIELWKRPISPQATSILFLPYIFLAVHPERQSVRLALIRAILIGIMAYSYTYHWTFALALEGLLFLEYLWTQRSHISMARIAATIAPIALIDSMWIWQQLSTKSAAATDVLERLGMMNTRWPSGVKWHMYTGAMLIPLAMIIRWKRHAAQVAKPLLLLLIAGIIALDQMLITGKELEFSSHYGSLIRINLIIVGLFCLHTFMQRKKQLSVLAAVLVIALGLVRTFTTEQIMWKNFREAKAEQVLEASIAQRLPGIIPNESIIAAPAVVGREIVIYSNHYLLFADNMHLHSMTHEELADRAIVWQQLFPNESVQKRWIMGSFALNSALRRKQECRAKNILFLQDNVCDQSPEDYLPDHWFTFKGAGTLSQQELIDGLRRYHVTHILSETLPEEFELELKKVAQLELYSLYKLILPETQNDASDSSST